MGFLSQHTLEKMGFRRLGKNVMISSNASIYFPENVSIGDNSRIDDFCTLSGEVSIGRNVHIAVYSNLAGGRCGITIGDFAGLAYGCHLIAQSDDYSGISLTNPTVPREFKNEKCLPVTLGNHVILGACSIVLPGVEIPEGVACGAQTLFTQSVDPWTIYIGSPARRLRERSTDLLRLAERFLSEEK